jgi:hypothetical protein
MSQNDVDERTPFYNPDLNGNGYYVLRIKNYENPCEILLTLKKVNQPWEVVRDFLIETEGYRQLYPDRTNCYENIMDYTDDQFNEKYGTVSKVDLYTYPIAKSADKKQARIDKEDAFKKFVIHTKTKNVELNGELHEVDMSELEHLKLTPHAEERNEERSKVVIDINKDLGNKETFKLGVNTTYTDEENRKKERYSIMTFVAQYILTRDKKRLITVWEHNTPFNE